MYNAYEDDLYDTYQDYDDSREPSTDGYVKTLIEELYNSSKIDKKAIAEALNGVFAEIRPEYFYDDEAFTAKDIMLSYQDSREGFIKTFGHWLDCMDPITGDMNYNKLLMGCTQYEKKNLTIFLDIFSACDAIMHQLTSWMPLDENQLGGALVYIAKKYGVDYDDILHISPNAKRK